MAGERNFAGRREDAQAIARLGVARGQQERRLDQVRPRGERLHVGVAPVARVDDHAERIAAASGCRKDVELQIVELRHERGREALKRIIRDRTSDRAWGDPFRRRSNPAAVSGEDVYAAWRRDPGCVPGLCGMSRMHATMKAARIAEASGRLKSSPPSSCGLSRKSPTVAPSGRVRMNAAQNNSTRETSVL